MGSARTQTIEHVRADRDGEFLARLLDRIPDSVFVYYVDEPELFKLVYVNRKAYETRGYDRDEMLAMRLTDVVAPEVLPRIVGWIEEFKRLGKLNIESVQRRKDGTTLPVEVSLELAEYAGRRVAVSTDRDISVRKRTEAERAQARRELQDSARSNLTVSI